MRDVTFSPEDLLSIKDERYQHPHPKVQQKMEVLWLLSKGLTHDEIADLADVGRTTVHRYLTEYLEGGLPRIRTLNYPKGQSELDNYKGELEAYFLEHPPTSAAEAQEVIFRLTGVRRGLTQVRHFLKKLSTSATVKSAPSPPKPTSKPKPSSSKRSSGRVWTRP